VVTAVDNRIVSMLLLARSMISRNGFGISFSNKDAAFERDYDDYDSSALLGHDFRRAKSVNRQAFVGGRGRDPRHQQSEVGLAPALRIFHPSC
jgi:hypothetical protein